MRPDLKGAWNLVECLLTRNNEKGLPSDEEVSDAVSVLKEHDLFEIVTEWFMEIFRRDLYSRIAPVFWSHFNTSISKDRVVPHVCQAFQQLYDDLHAYSPCFERLGHLQQLAATPSHTDDLEKVIKDTEDRAKLLLKAIGFTSATRPFQEAMLELYSKAFKAFDAATPEPSADESGDDDLLCCPGCDEDRDTCTCTQTIKAFHILNRQLSELGLLERLSGEPVSEIIHQRIQLHIERTCKGNFEQPYIAVLEQWLESKVVGWLELLYGRSQGSTVDSCSKDTTSNETPNHSPITAHKGRLYHFLYTVYATTRISELFAVIIEFPDSQPALQDLKACLEKTDLRSHLVTSLRTALETRLLHPGVNTSDILTAYISAIRALRVLDPSGVLLELVCQPVRTYLRCREDTVRCIVSSLTEDSSSELSDELVKGEPLVLNESYHGDDETEDWQNWMPDPVDADPVKMVLSRRSSDIISMLVNIYGSKELFVNEYRTLLADRILTHFNYDTEKEIRYLELLKLRFGESQLHYCEVMLKDVADSKRINTHIQDRRIKRQEEKKAQAEQDQENKEEEEEEEQPLQHVNAMILSAEFWPTFREEKLELPEVFQKSLDVYTKSFEALKGNRTLNWKNHLGLVNLELELKDRKMELNVSPVHATIIWHFQEKAQWSVEELSSTMMMPTASIRRKMALWQSHGLLREESADVFVLVEEAKGKGDEVVTVEEDEAESAMASASDQRAEEMQVVWSYIVGMLTNLESLPLERIHSMLKMFAMQGPSSECSLSELKDFLDRKVKEQKLSYSTGVYRLPKPGT